MTDSRKLCVCLLLACLIPTTEGIVNVTAGILLMSDGEEPFTIRQVAPALDLAFQYSEQYYGVHFNAIYKNYSEECPYETGVGYLADLYYNYNADVIFGPACTETFVATGRLANFLNIPIVSGVGHYVHRKEGDMFDTFTRLSFNLRKLSISIKAIMAEYEWRHVAVLYDITYDFFDISGSNLVYDLRYDASLPRPYDIPFVPTEHMDLAALLQEASRNARVFILFCRAHLLREILYEADQLGYTNGGYVFITMELVPSHWMGHYMEFKEGDFMDASVTRGFESVLVLTMRQADNPEFLVFAEELRNKSITEWGYDFGHEVVNYFLSAFYDGVIYLANSINQTVTEGGEVNSTYGIKISQKFWNTTFTGITGPVKIDEFGDRVADFDVLDMTNPDKETFKSVGSFYGASNKYVPNGREIRWPDGLPIDRPRCGFTGDDPICDEDNHALVIGLAGGGAALVGIAVVAFLIYRRKQMEAELDMSTWLIPFSEIVISSAAGQGSMMMARSQDMSQAGDADSQQGQRQVFTLVGNYSGSAVAIRKLRQKSVTLNRAVLQEFRQIKHNQHTNLVRFVGAYIEPDEMGLVVEYCSRGSLADIIESENLDMDWTVRNSLITDVIKGMHYLHHSSMKLHGHLTSTNCVIDSRFLLKLTDFGLPTIYKQDRELDANDPQFNPYKLLWTAPELLRSSQWYVGTQEGDVYSFGIILSEIIARASPFSDMDMDARDIVENVKQKSQTPFRPVVDEESCKPQLLNLMQSCWKELPEDRPTFNNVVSMFKTINKGYATGNIMDTLMKRMEMYANNLEGLVGERTKAYQEEKKKAQELLHRLLPEAIATQLESGNVEPETFECVTIYFSDIVGFTTLSASSTPLQVVDLLNDLYTCFDTIIDHYDVYKVETIGDAYMVASGLPTRNGDRHAVEVADMSLDILKSVKKFKIRHRPDEQLNIRIGLHSGSLVAGVVGLKMPRYCLFGDTVNTASRMESNSVSLRIHMSSPTRNLLVAYGGYDIETRGEIEVKGKGMMTTYWLEGHLPKDAA